MKREEKIKRLKEYCETLFDDPTTELEYETEFQLLVAIIMSAQVTDKQVNKVNSVFFQDLKHPQD
jgi:endonuclease-3